MCRNTLSRTVFFLGLGCFALVQGGSSNAQRHQDITVKFEMNSTKLENRTKVFITGNLPQLGDWNPSKIPMTSIGNHRWICQIKCKPDFPIEYKYTLGSWKREGADSNGHALQNLVLRTKTDRIVKDQISFWTKGVDLTVRGQVTGLVKYHRQMKSPGIVPRDIIVWLPPGYKTARDRYPVLYMNDGQNIVDPKTSTFGVDWQIDETCTKLINEQKIQSLIVVGIYNTPERVGEYLPGETGRAYGQFVTTVLKPFIDENYRTKPDRNNTAVAGSSAGGICAFTLAWKNPKLFSKAICMSPSFNYRKPDGKLAFNYVEAFKKSTRPNPIPYFYIDNGGIGLEEWLQPGIDEMLVAMKEKGLIENKHFTWKSFPDDRHSESAWAKRLPAVMLHLYKRK